MLTPRLSLRLLPVDELEDDPHPDVCVEVVFGPVFPANDPTSLVCPEPLRIAPADLLRLHLETEFLLKEIRTLVQAEETAWSEQRGRWIEEGRQAVNAGSTDIDFLRRLLDGLNNLA